MSNMPNSKAFDEVIDMIYDDKLKKDEDIIEAAKVIELNRIAEVIEELITYGIPQQ